MIRMKLKQMLIEKSYKEGRRITLKELGEATGISRPTLSRMANIPGYRTSTDSLNLLCEFFNCQPGDLLEWVEDPDEPKEQ